MRGSATEKPTATDLLIKFVVTFDEGSTVCSTTVPQRPPVPRTQRRGNPDKAITDYRHIQCQTKRISRFSGGGQQMVAVVGECSFMVQRAPQTYFAQDDVCRDLLFSRRHCTVHDHLPASAVSRPEAVLNKARYRCQEHMVAARCAGPSWRRGVSSQFKAAPRCCRS